MYCILASSDLVYISSHGLICCLDYQFVYFLRVIGTIFHNFKLSLVANCDISIIFVVAGHQVDKRKDYMSLEVANEDELKETVVIKTDEQTKVKRIESSLHAFCTCIITLITQVFM